MVKEVIDISFKNNSGVLKCSPHIFKLIREKFSVVNPSYMARRFSPRKYIITPSGVFPIGLWEEMDNFISSLQIPVQVNVSDEFKKVFSPAFSNYELENIEGFTYYDHQKDTIKEFLKNGRGIGLLSVSSGKSLLAAGLIKTILKYNPTFRCLIIVPNVGLVNQLFNSFHNEFNMPIISRWGDGFEPDWNSPVIVANSQILISDIPYTVSKVKDFDMVIVDEVHTLGEKKNKINKVVHNMNTSHRFGLTGTLPNGYLAIWNVIGKIGPIVYEFSSYEARKKGVASEVEIKVVLCKHLSSPDKPTKDELFLPTARYIKEQQFIYSHSGRNDVILKLANKLQGNILILVDVIDHGERLLKLISENTKKKVYFIQGSMDTEDRTSITELMETTDDVVVVGMSKIFSTGISIKNLPYVIFVCIGKSGVQIAQSIGRSMRLHENKSKAIIYDIADNTEYSLDHLKQRLQIYSKEKLPFKITKITI